MTEPGKMPSVEVACDGATCLLPKSSHGRRSSHPRGFFDVMRGRTRCRTAGSDGVCGRGTGQRALSLTFAVSARSLEPEEQKSTTCSAWRKDRMVQSTEFHSRPVSGMRPGFLGFAPVRRMIALLVVGVSAFCVPHTFAVAGSTPAVMTSIDDQTSPDTLIRTVTEQIQDEIRQRAIDVHDTARIMDIVNRDILPYTDIRRTTRLALGRYWLVATPAQRDELTKQFQLLLIHTYAGALGMLTADEKFQYPRGRDVSTSTDVIVRTIAIYNGHPVEINYRLYRSDAGWRVYDLNLLGVWLVQIYRNQFTDEISRSGVDGLIRLLTDRNHELAGVRPFGTDQHVLGRQDRLSPEHSRSQPLPGGQ